VWPALTRLMAMGRPMMPSPMTATLLMMVLFLKSLGGAGGERNR
jgi:hypothetical protein